MVECRRASFARDHMGHGRLEMPDLPLSRVSENSEMEGSGNTPVGNDERFPTVDEQMAEMPS